MSKASKGRKRNHSKSMSTQQSKKAKCSSSSQSHEAHINDVFEKYVGTISADTRFCVGTEQTTADDGRCVLHALKNCGFPELTTEDLDAQIEPALAARKKAHHFNKYNEEWKAADVGRPGIAWALDLVLRALKQKYGKGNFIWRKKKPADLWEATTGKFYISGVLRRDKWKGLLDNNDDDDDDAGAVDDVYTRLDWHHAICVDADNNKIFDSNLDDPIEFESGSLREILQRDWFEELWSIRECEQIKKIEIC